LKVRYVVVAELTSMPIYLVSMQGPPSSIRIGLVARICRSHSSKEDQNRQGRGSIPRFGNLPFAVWPHGRTVVFWSGICRELMISSMFGEMSFFLGLMKAEV
jgi:hypothetical protein